MSSSIKKEDADIALRARKFLFDTNDFDVQEVEETVEPEPTFSGAELEQARAAAYAEGRTAGLREALEKQEERIAQTLDKTIVLVETLAAAEDRREIGKCRDAVRLALRIAHKILPQFSKTVALPEVERVILDSLEQRHDEPRVAVSVHASLLEPLQARIGALAREKGYAGKIILMADEALKETDCRVEWADGGAERIYDVLVGKVEGELAHAVASLTAIEETQK